MSLKKMIFCLVIVSLQININIELRGYICILGEVFVDHTSSTIIIYNQVSLGASDIVRRKELYELWATEHGVSVKSYRGNNGVYTSNMFKEDLTLRQ